MIRENEDKVSNLDNNFQTDEIMEPVELITLESIYTENKQFFNGLNNEDLQSRMQNSNKSQYGNFDKYYNPEKSSNNEVRDRLAILPSSYFTNKKVLDIGCNDGTFTLALTLEFDPSLIIGIDIDNKLISRAIKNVHKVTNDIIAKAVVDGIEEQKGTAEGNEKLILEGIEALPKSLRLSLSMPSVVKALSNKEGLINKISKESKDYLYERLCFRTENFIANLETPVFEKFDVIVCLKTIKWVHLNFGDVGALAIFHKIYESLEPNGLFIFDSSNWKSYKKAKGASDETKKNFETMEFRPADFDTYLKARVGFVFKEALKFEREEKRPLLVYQKPE
jgi:7SK snRNA methylphosphate capping enzyme